MFNLSLFYSFFLLSLDVEKKNSN